MELLNMQHPSEHFFNGAESLFGKILIDNLKGPNPIPPVT